MFICKPVKLEIVNRRIAAKTSGTKWDVDSLRVEYRASFEYRAFFEYLHNKLDKVK